MIRSAPIARTGTLKQGKPLARKTPMARGTGFKPAVAGAGLLRVAAVQLARKPMKKSRGLKGRAPTVAESSFMDAVASLGCIACAKDGKENPLVSLHHIDGRTKPGAHLLVLPLCAGHHQDGTGEDRTMIAVHPYKARFEARYGTQQELLCECIERLESKI